MTGHRYYWLFSTITLPQSRVLMLLPGRDIVLQPGGTVSARPAGRTGLWPTGKCKLSLRQTGKSLSFSKKPRGVGLRGRHRIFTESTSPNLWAGRSTRKGHPTAQRGPSWSGGGGSLFNQLPEMGSWDLPAFTVWLEGGRHFSSSRRSQGLSRVAKMLGRIARGRVASDLASYRSRLPGQ